MNIIGWVITLKVRSKSPSADGRITLQLMALANVVAVLRSPWRRSPCETRTADENVQETSSSLGLTRHTKD